MSNPVVRIAGRALRGGLAGAIATVPMSAVLAAAGALGFMGRQPPRVIVDAAFPGLRERPARALPIVAHIGFGAACGGLAALTTARGNSQVLRGAAFGVLVWAASYEGWIPAFGILPPAHRDERGRAITMPIAHVVFGATLAIAHGALPTECPATKNEQTGRHDRRIR